MPSDEGWGQERPNSETEEDSGNESAHEQDVDTRVLRMLYKGNVAEVNRREEQQRKAKVVNHKHDFYRQTRCSTTAHEEQSAIPAGVINTHEDSDDDEAFAGEQQEIAKEIQELRAAQQWVNQEGWDAAGEGVVWSQTGEEIDLRLDWEEVKRKLAKGCGAGGDANAESVEEEAVLRDYPLDKLDPTQRVFADRVLAWAAEVACTRTWRRRGGAGVYRCCARGWAARPGAASPPP